MYIMVIYLVMNNLKDNFMFFKKENNFFWFLIVIFFSICLLFFDFYYNLSNKIYFYTDRIIFFYYYIFNNVKFFIKNKIIYLSDLEKIYEENIILKKKYMYLKGFFLNLTSLKLENIFFRKMLHFPLLKKKINNFILVKIFFYYLNNIDEIFINHIYDPAIKYGSLLFNNFNMLGKVIYSGNFFSKVQLICNKNSVFPVSILRNNINSIIMGYGCNNNMKINDFPIDSDVKLGDIIVLPQIDNFFFSGYPVGIVDNVYLDLVNGFLVADVKYFLDLNDLNFVFLFN